MAGTVRGTGSGSPAEARRAVLSRRGQRKATGVVTPDRKGPRVLENDFPALPEECGLPLSWSPTARGTAFVICFSERYDLTLPASTVRTVREVVDVRNREYGNPNRKNAWVAIFAKKA